MSSFDDEERRSKLAVVPKSVNEGKVVQLAPKKLTTEREVRTVLAEDQYLANLEKIIVRDYFPELPKLKAQAEYMDAVSRNDVAKMRELQLRYNTQRRTERRTSPSMRNATSPSRPRATSPLQFDPATPGPSGVDETPMPYVNEEGDNERNVKSKKKNENEDLTIDGYLHKFTSQDNASFEELTALAARRERAKNAWLYEAAESHNKEKVVYGAIAAAADLQLALKYDPEAIKEKPKALDNWNYVARNHVLFYPEGAKLTPEEQVQNALKNQRIINKSGTRFPDDLKNKPSESSMARAVMMQAANQAGKVDVMGREATLPARTLGLVAEPSPAPGVEDSPFMTWGEIDGTPFRLDATDVQAPVGDAPAFKMPEVPYRELIAQGITDTISQRYRDKRKTAMECAERAHKTPRFGSARSTDQFALLSPAARRLATNKLGIRLGSSSTKISKPLTPSMQSPGFRTPGSSSRSSLTRTPVSAMIRKTTPKTSSITDNLMNLPDPSTADSSQPSGSRASAGDFF